jgi:hypothetical protein
VGPRIIKSSQDSNNIISLISTARHFAVKFEKVIKAEKLFLEHSFSNLTYIGHWTFVSKCSENS